MSWVNVFHWFDLRPGTESSLLTQSEIIAFSFTLVAWGLSIVAFTELYLHRKVYPRQYAHFLLGLMCAGTLCMVLGFLMTETNLVGRLKKFDDLANNVYGLQAALINQIGDTVVATDTMLTALHQLYALNTTVLDKESYYTALYGVGTGRQLLQGMFDTVRGVDLRPIVYQVESDLRWFDAIRQPTFLGLGILVLLYILAEYILRNLSWRGPTMFTGYWDRIVFGCFTMFLWAGAFQLLAGTLLGASVCYDPTAVAVASMNDTVATYYTRCNIDSTVVFPYASALTTATTTLHSLHTEALNATTVCGDVGCPAPLFLAVVALQSAVDGLHDAVGMPGEGLVGLISCSTVNGLYQTLTAFLCDDLGAAFADYFMYTMLFNGIWWGSFLIYTLLKPLEIINKL